MASEWVMYISVIAIGVLTIAGVTITFNAINQSTLENTIEVELNEVATTIASELKDMLELGLSMDPLTQVMINRSLSLPYDVSGHSYEVTFIALPGAKHFFIKAVDTSDQDVSTIQFETTIPWRNVTLSNVAGTGLPQITSGVLQHFISFQRTEGTDSFKIVIW
ncbi:MAG: hypothetical protein KGD59_10420 [Candidatus Heimdallarchaeota archaeon]|jgi:hypothetical protein|nr:hypothetical protein [Candidatus Heimdallarchaeota archaeon]MBY8994953.1 hypothetical protein [Candidatus Heimdallarchaeota archaeon]